MNAQAVESHVLRIAVDAHILPAMHSGAGRYAKAIGRLLARDGVHATAVTRGLLLWRKRRAVSALFGVGDVPVARNVPADANLVFHPFSLANFDAHVSHVGAIHSLAALTFADAEAEQDLRARKALRRTAEISSAIIVPSQFTAGQVATKLGVSNDRIHVVPYTCEDIFMRSSLLAPDPLESFTANALRGRPYILHVGATTGMRRNFDVLRRAWKRTFPNAEVALITTADVPGLDGGIITVRKPDDAMLAQLYRYALAVAVPAIGNNFGLSMLEAFAASTPVIAAADGALPATGGPAPYWVKRADDEIEWSIGLRRLADDAELRAILSDLGRARVREFSREANEAMTMDIFNRVSKATAMNAAFA